ncbi:MAG TPA: hypothetical protein VN833_29895 [Candidatus Acidoferrales bacterium]|nr:hypothetical protein [Candidatus Acidoferrales bacterium]
MQQRRGALAGANSDLPLSEKFQAAYLTFIQIWDAQHIAGILYLKYFYVVVYSDGG